MTGGVLLALLTSLSWACGNVLVSKSSRSLGAVRATLWALVVGAIAAGALSLAFGERRMPLAPADIAWTVAAGAAGLLGYACLFQAFSRAPLSLAVPIVSSWSLIAGIVAFTLLGERPRPVALVGAATVFTGVLLVAIGSRAGADPARPRGRAGLFVPLGAALGFGVMVPALTRVAPVWGALGGTAVVYALVVALGLPIAFGARLEVAPPTARVLWLVIATALAETLGFVCVSLARRYAPITVVTPVSSLAATFTVVYAWVVLGERPPRLAAAGAGLACVGVLILSL